VFEVALQLYLDEKARLTILELVQGQREDVRMIAQVEVEVESVD
jgi:hypothetical protein